MTTPRWLGFENGEVDAIEQISSQYFDHLNEYLTSFGRRHYVPVDQSAGTSPRLPRC